MLTGVFLTLSIAVGTAVLQTFMRGLSRTDVQGKQHNLQREDALFWSDWCVAGALAFFLAFITASGNHEPIPKSQLISAFIVILFSFTGLPFGLRVFAYDPDAKLKSLPPSGVGWIIIANALGLFVLAVTVFSGIAIYEWK